MSDATTVIRELIDAYDAGELALFADAVVRARECLAKPATVAQTDATALSGYAVTADAVSISVTHDASQCSEAFYPLRDPLMYGFLRAYLAAAPTPTGDSVPMPQNADQAALMCLLGEKWLATNAPERLKKAAAPTPAQPAVEPVALPTRRYRLADDGWGLQLDPEGQYVHVHDLAAPPARTVETPAQPVAESDACRSVRRYLTLVLQNSTISETIVARTALEMLPDAAPGEGGNA